MKRIFYTAGVLLCVNGILHLVKLFTGAWDPNASVAMFLTGLFGLAYLVIGVMLLRLREAYIWPGVIVPAVGLLLVLVGLKPNPDSFTIAFIVLDLLIVAACVYALFMGRAPLRRVS